MWSESVKSCGQDRLETRVHRCTPSASKCTKITRLLQRPTPKLYSKFEVNRIRIAVRIVWKPGCTFGRTGASTLHLHAPKSIGFFTDPYLNYWSESDKNHGQDRLETRVHLWVHRCTPSAPTCTKINRLLYRPIPKLYSKFEVIRIRIAVRIVWKPKGWKKERKKKKKKKNKHGHFINPDLNTKY